MNLTNNSYSPNKMSTKPTRWRLSQMELESELLFNYEDSTSLGRAVLNAKSTAEKNKMQKEKITQL